MTFENAVKLILKLEGGYVIDGNDPGGETKFGISKRAYPNLNISDLSEGQATEIYRLDYWDIIQADKLPDQIRLLMFDCAVNQGVKRSVRMLQGIVGAEQDGIMGLKTLTALSEFPTGYIFSELARARLHHYCQLPIWNKFGKGWAKRLIDVVLESVEII